MIIPRIESSSRPFQGLLINVEVDTLSRGDGKTFIREVARVTDVVAIAAIDDEGRILLIKQYRHSMRGPVWEIPAGRLDVAGETPAEAAARELREEADVLAESLEPLSVFGNSVGWTTETTHLFCARGLTATTPFERLCEEADIEKAWVSLPEARAMIQNGTIADAKTIIGILLSS
ncbi:MAG: NUDIX hydrolase [Coriobacteriia bacterium]|nr:NUDIX hydrolase [Coriobacteriia bacterium]MCL2750732.1 NUDIX hydrolase [Coriobacteriia bacterium]